MDQLKNYQTVQKETVNVVQPKVAQISPAIYLQNDNNVVQSNNRFDWKELRRTGLHQYPELQKNAIDFAMESYVLPKYKAYDANELWRVASKGFNESAQYIDINGYIIDSIAKLPVEFKDDVQRKILQQFNLNDTKGIIFRPESTLSLDISNSIEFQNYIKNNIEKLLNGAVISDSLRFESNRNLKYSLASVDVLNTYMNPNGDIVAYILDTYDFNQNDPDWKVEWAYNVQKNNLLTPFYILSVVIVPSSEWANWF